MLNKWQKVQPNSIYKEILETKITNIYTSSWEVLWKHKIWANELQSIGTDHMDQEKTQNDNFLLQLAFC